MKKNVLLVILMFCCSMIFSQKLSKVQTLQLAKNLAVYGYENESVSALLQAANLLLDINPKKIEITVKREGVSSDRRAEKSLDFTPEKLFEAANELAGTDKTFREWIKKTERRISGSRGATITPQYDSNFAHGNDGYTTCQISFKANEIAEVYVNSIDYADLDLYIYDEYGKLIVSDERTENDCIVSFYPSYTGPFTIQVKNRAAYNASYLLVTN